MGSTCKIGAETVDWIINYKVQDIFRAGCRETIKNWDNSEMTAFDEVRPRLATLEMCPPTWYTPRERFLYAHARSL